jgi:hypothetical protein
VRKTPTLAAAISRWPFFQRHGLEMTCAPPERSSPNPQSDSAPSHRVTLTLDHHLDVSLVTSFLVHQLGCDGWHVASRHDHQLVVQLTRGGVARYCLAYDCSPPIEKAVYHGSRAWALAIIPVHGEADLAENRVAEIKSGLAGLHNA